MSKKNPKYTTKRVEDPLEYTCNFCGKKGDGRILRHHGVNCAKFDINKLNKAQIALLSSGIEVPNTFGVTEASDEIETDNSNILPISELPEKASIVLTSLAKTLVANKVLTCSINDAVALMSKHLNDIETSLLQYSRQIHISDLKDAFKLTNNSGLSKQISDLLNFESMSEEYDIYTINFEDCPNWTLDNE